MKTEKNYLLKKIVPKIAKNTKNFFKNHGKNIDQHNKYVINKQDTDFIFKLAFIIGNTTRHAIKARNNGQTNKTFDFRMFSVFS